jgi:beta-lactam-binding protein with PASTA domain
VRLPEQPGWLGVLLGVAGGFLLGVVLIVALGGVVHDHTRLVRHTVTATRTVTTTTTVKVKVTPPHNPNEVIVPDVVGESLDTADQDLADAGLDDDVNGGGVFGVLDPENWRVTAQDPRSGNRVHVGTVVTLDIERD